MATVKISELPAITGDNTASDDVVPIVDVSGNITNKITRDEFFKNIQGNVGIGTSTINNPFSVATAVQIGSTSAASSLLTLAGSGGGAIYFADAADAYAGYIGYQHVDNSLRIGTGTSERMRIDASGNVGIGVTPSAWRTTATSVLQVDGTAITGFGNYASTITQNAYLDSTSTWRYIASGEQALRIGLDNDGSISFSNAPSGTAGNAISFTQAMTLNASGNLGIGTTAPVTPLHVAGASMTTGVTYKYQPAQTSKAAAATLTIAELLTGIIQYTGAVATLTLPTGTLIEGGVPATFPTDMSFDFSVINTGTGIATLGTATGLTLVGNMAVALASSGRFRARKTATNTFTIYRIS